MIYIKIKASFLLLIEVFVCTIYPHHVSVSFAFVINKNSNSIVTSCSPLSSDNHHNTNTINSDDKHQSTKSKRIVLIRHGCTYMNEYLSREGTRWGDPTFTDIFTDPSDIAKYRDSPLSPRGIGQAERLSCKLAGNNEDDGGYRINVDESNIIEEIELIACSPLRRALQTMELALYPNIWPGNVPIVALPQASERVYLISDLGTSKVKLKEEYPIVDFDSEIPDNLSDAWWFSLNNEIKDDSIATSTIDNYYIEWRPIGQGQTYSCPGEPLSAFNERMASLYDWLDSRDEATIALICHWGVIDWLTGSDFDNCEMRVVDFASMRRTGFMLTDEQADEVFGQGERCVVRDEES